MLKQPNILYIFTDQQSHFAMSCAGNIDLHTPNMDRIANEGVMFENAYVSQPLCTPCRGSMFTGVMPHECGTHSNGNSIDKSFQKTGLSNIMAGAGYDCYYGGKWHVPEGSMPESNEHGFVVYDRGKYREQLFDLSSDRGEMVNLAVERRYADLLSSHRQTLKEFVIATADRFSVPE